MIYCLIYSVKLRMSPLKCFHKLDYPSHNRYSDYRVFLFRKQIVISASSFIAILNNTRKNLRSTYPREVSTTHKTTTVSGDLSIKHGVQH